MALITPTIVKVGRGLYTITWLLLTNGDTGVPYDASMGAPFFPDKTVHVYGTFDTGTLTMQGANNSASPSYVALTDIHANAAAYTAESIDVIAENPLLIRPSAAGGASTSLNVVIAAHAIRPVR